jgi:hypothetical protein
MNFNFGSTPKAAGAFSLPSSAPATTSKNHLYNCLEQTLKSNHMGICSTKLQ